ncbi:ParB/RepB/Spo0J family partition protein [Natranaerofaba carboxydovora]|uniref:ParB/RepB/Spo0J family partition protein n=1 Tax=Natranaerofaba carboxydovora TaxID=2742683 RepID=UPI001F131498|nr:ParB/RepB/Spo0J family partition protein [Natranaerofaba carboxydovora]UMZ75177.1 putative chromosome-partitioning protein ParB [Natranaerofaba carboxydovora]
MDKRGLGKGLDALIPELSEEEKKNNISEVDINKLRANPNQPRKSISDEKIRELTESIKNHGVLQPLIVRKLGELYQIIAGERRWKAAKEAGLKKVPIILKDLSDSEVMQVALLENIQREDLNPLEKSLALNKLIEEHGLTQEELSKTLGKSRSSIANTLRLINLEEEVQNMVNEGLLSDGHARILLSLKRESQIEAANHVCRKGLSVRQTEEYVKKLKDSEDNSNKKDESKEDNPFYNEIQDKLEKQLGTKVRILKGKKKGKIEIEFVQEDELNKLSNLLLKED